MDYMIIRQEVTDLARFEQVFDGLKEERLRAGLTDLGQFCAADDTNTVIVVLEVADIARAKDYWHSNVLAKGRVEAGIVGSLEAGTDQVWLTDGLVKERIEINSTHSTSSSPGLSRRFRS
jgi:hypothetical protein